MHSTGFCVPCVVAVSWPLLAICHNVDLGDSWEWADEPRYDEKFSALSFRIASNYIVYSMTH